MNHPERGSRRITSIPPSHIPIDVLRRRAATRTVIDKTDWSKTVAEYVLQEAPRKKKARPEPFHKNDGEIRCGTEVMKDYDDRGSLGIILRFTGIGLTKGPFLKSRHNRPDGPVFYIPIVYNNKIGARLFLATRGDIFESQVVLAQMDVNPLFQEELYLPPLATTHNPASMAVRQNNGLVIVGYNPRTY